MKSKVKKEDIQRRPILKAQHSFMTFNHDLRRRIVKRIDEALENIEYTNKK